MGRGMETDRNHVWVLALEGEVQSSVAVVLARVVHLIIAVIMGGVDGDDSDVMCVCVCVDSQSYCDCIMRVGQAQIRHC